MICLLFPGLAWAQVVDLPEIPEEETELPENPAQESFVLVDREPAVLNYDSIAYRIGYPMILRDAGIQGDVVVRVLVDSSGQYVKHKVLEAAHPLLQMVVEDHIHELEFVPASYQGTPMAFWVNIPFQFRLLDPRKERRAKRKRRK